MALVPLRFAVRYNPASLAIEYRDESTGKVALHEMAVTLEADSSGDSLLQALRCHHDRFLRDDIVSIRQCVRLLEMIITNHGAAPLKEAATPRSSPPKKVQLNPVVTTTAAVEEEDEPFVPNSARSFSSIVTLGTLEDDDDEEEDDEETSFSLGDESPVRSPPESPVTFDAPPPVGVLEEKHEIMPPSPPSPAAASSSNVEEFDDKEEDVVEEFEEEDVEEEEEDYEDDDEGFEDESPAVSPLGGKTQIVREDLSDTSKKEETVLEPMPIGATLHVDSDSSDEDEVLVKSSPVSIKEGSDVEDVEEADSDFEFDGVENLDSDGSEGYTFD